MNLEQLYAEHYKSVYYTCYKFLQNEEDAKDMTQNVFIKAFDKIDSLNDASKFKSWINRIAANECINELKKTNRLKLEELTATNADGENFEYLEDETQKSPEELMVDDDVRDILLHIINKLPQDQRIAVHLYYYQDMTVKEISQIFGCSEQTTRNRLGYARKNIKKEVDKLEDKGVQLRSIALLPFLYLIFQAEESFAQVAVPAYSTLTATASANATVANADISSSAVGTPAAATTSSSTASTTATSSGATSTAAAGATKSAVLFGLSMKAVIAIIATIIVVAIGVVVAVLPKDDNSGKDNRTEASLGDANDESNSNDDLDDANVNTDADASWGKVKEDEWIDLSHTSIGDTTNYPFIYSSLELTSTKYNGDYFIIPLKDKYNTFETPYLLVEDDYSSQNTEYTEPSELHFEYNENAYTQYISGPVYMVKKELASDVVANKEYLTPKANIDLGEFLINGHKFSLPFKLSEITAIELTDMSIINGNKIEKYSSIISSDTPTLNVIDSQIMLEPGEILVLNYGPLGYYGAETIWFTIYNPTDSQIPLRDSTVYAVTPTISVFFPYYADPARSLTPQVCFPGYVSLVASHEYVMGQYGIPIAIKYDISSGFDVIFEGKKYGFALSHRMDYMDVQYSTHTYYYIQDDVLYSFLREHILIY